jgi:hypothetical protein
MSQSQFRSFLDRDFGKDATFTKPTGEETPPRICDPKNCKIVACPARNNPDAWGKPCIYYTAKNQSTPQVDPTKPPTTPTFEQRIEKAFEKAFASLETRLKAIEQEARANEVRSLNGNMSIPEPLPVGFPRLYQENLRRKN